MKTKRLFIAGGRGMVGQALVRRAREHDWEELLTPTHQELDLCNQPDVFEFLRKEKPQAIIVAAAKVGGIHANSTYPAEFIYQNLAIASNIIEGARLAEIERLLFLGSSCIYPKFAEQPIREGSLLTSPLEPTNEAYALAKIAGLKLCQFYRSQYGLMYHSAMPTNLYGPGDNYHALNSHVVPALLRRFHEAKVAGSDQVTIWGTGTPLREFLHVDDLADACFHLLDLSDPPDWANIGSGEELSIFDLAAMIAEIAGFTGTIEFDSSKPDGTPRKFLDCSLIRKTGWVPKIVLKEGLTAVYNNIKDSL